VLGAAATRAARDPRRFLRAIVTLMRLPYRPRVMRIRALGLALRAAWIADRIERGGGCRLVHGHFALAQTEVAMAVGVLVGAPFSFTAHARDIYDTPSGLPEKMRAAALVVTCTGYNVTWLRRLAPDVPAARVQLAYHGVAMDAFRARGAPAGDHPVVLAAGRFVDKKGFDVLVSACRILRDRGLDFTCRIVGDGPLGASLAALVQQAQLQQVVELPGWIPPAGMVGAFRDASVFVMPSRVSAGGDRDGIPNVILEAMAAGLPVVATGVSGIPEAVRHGESGLIVPPDDPAALAEAIGRLVRDPARARALGEAGERHVRERFDLAVSSARLAALFRCYDAHGVVE
jgi:glycosyltransferase involved in cell wall biosynthesis